MNLRVDLILHSEQRSASPVSIKFLARILGFAALAGLALFVIINLLAIGNIKSKLRIAEARWQDIVPHREESVKLIQQTTEHLEILSELEGWQHSRLSLDAQMRQLAVLIPQDVQLQSLHIQHEFMVVGGKAIGRLYSMSMAGTSPARGADRNVQDLKRKIEEDELFKPLVELVEVPVFQEDPRNRTNRVFQIASKYRPRSFSP